MRKQDLSASLTGNYWSFGRDDGFVLSPVVCFLPRGVVGGYYNAFEQCWEVRDGNLCFQTLSGETTTRFDQLVWDRDGLIELSGRSVPAPQTRHVLRKVQAPSCVDFGNAAEPGLPHFFTRIDSAGLKPRRNLVVLRANAQSLHSTWARDIAAEDRNWDLCISWYGAELPADPGEAEYLVHQPRERKFGAIHRLFADGTPLCDYDYVWMPDDDIATSWKDVNRLFNIARRQGLLVAQPSIRADSYPNHKITVTDPGHVLRFTQFVEVMCPLFSSEALGVVLPTLAGSISGFGLDHLWPSLLGRQAGRMAIIDDVAVAHTRPLGQNYDISQAIQEELLLMGAYRASQSYQVDGGLTRSGGNV